MLAACQPPVIRVPSDKKQATAHPRRGTGAGSNVSGAGDIRAAYTSAEQPFGIDPEHA